MPTHSMILLILIVVSAALTAAYAIHRARAGRSEVIVPDSDDMSRLGHNLDRVREIRRVIAGAEGHLDGRISVLGSTVRTAGEEHERVSTDVAARTFLEVRESSESSARQLLTRHAHQQRNPIAPAHR